MPMVFGASREEGSSSSREVIANRRKPKKTLAERMSAFDRIIQLCSVRDRSTQELRERLSKDAYLEDDIEQALTRAVSCGLLDDMRFADSFIRGQLNAGKGARKIQIELEKHHIELECIPGWPENYGADEQSQIDAAYNYLQGSTFTAKDMWGKGYRKLISRGYSSAVASKACRLWAEGARN